MGQKSFSWTLLLATVSLLVIWGCSDASSGSDDGSGDADTDADTDSDSDTDSDVDTSGTIALCPAECDRLMEPACPGYTLDQCESDCEFITRLPDCQEEYQAYFDCSDGKSAVCNADGNPYMPLCTLQLSVALLCAWDSVPNQELAQKCDDYCATSEATCGDDRPDCPINCQTFGTKGTGCDQLWEDHLDCVAEATLKNCLLGIFNAAGCGESWWDWLDCINQ